MKEVFEAVPDMVLPAVVFLAIVSILVGAALFDKIGKRMESEGEDFTRMSDSQAVQDLCERESPLIQCIGKKRWDVGEKIAVAKIFAAADAEGNSVDVMVLDITDQDGFSVIESYQKDTGHAVFSRRGVYTFSLAAMDGQRKRGTGKFAVLIDGE